MGDKGTGDGGDGWGTGGQVMGRRVGEQGGQVMNGTGRGTGGIGTITRNMCIYALQRALKT